MFLAALGCAKISVFDTLAILKGFKNDNVDVWLQINHGAFGIGGLIGPFIVYFYEINAFAFIGILMVLHFWIYFQLPSP